MPEIGRPVLFVLAGVNGAGKSSVGGELLARHGLVWFNPDRVARALRLEGGLTVARANAEAWRQGVARLREALRE